jgi:phosphoribosylaminoimidazole carboxylase (NCAIR synthetase)
MFTITAGANSFGTGEGNRLEGVREILRDPDLKLHVYGKTNAALRRKMAHFTVLGETVDDAIARAERARAALHWVDDRVTSRT